jgi:glycosyltransferase involved in cell wall biosynthesis
MKILQVSNYFKPSWEGGGPTRVAYELSKALVKRGHEVTVYTTDGFKNRVHAPRNKPVEVDGIQVFYFSNLSNLLASRTNIQTPFLAPPIIERDISNHDVIHIHEGNALLGTVVHCYAREHSVPYVLQLHGGIGRPTKTFVSSRRRAARGVFSRRILSDAEVIIALTESERDSVMSLSTPGTKIRVVPNGVNWSNYEYLPKRGAFRHKYGIGESERVVMYLGRINKVKGLDLLLRAFSGLSKVRRDVKLAIVGPDDGYLREVKRMIRELGISARVLIPGPLRDEEVTQAYVDSDIYVLPSTYDMFPLTVLEASACKLPVVATQGCGIRDFVEKVGRVVSREENELAARLLELLDDRSLRTAIGEKAREEVERHYTWRTIVETVESIYEEAARSEGRMTERALST